MRFVVSLQIKRYLLIPVLFKCSASRLKKNDQHAWTFELVRTIVREKYMIFKLVYFFEICFFGFVLLRYLLDWLRLFQYSLFSG